MSKVTPIRRPHFARRGVLHLVQQTANEIAAEHRGKIPDIFLLDARLRQKLDAQPDLIDRDRVVRSMRQFWERAGNQLLSAKPGANLFVPGAYVTLGKRVRGRMDSLDPLAEVNAWLKQDAEIVQNFMGTMNRRREYQLQRIAEATVNPDCKTLGELETKLHGYVPSPLDATPFADDDDDDHD